MFHSLPLYIEMCIYFAMTITSIALLYVKFIYVAYMACFKFFMVCVIPLGQNLSFFTGSFSKLYISIWKFVPYILLVSFTLYLVPLTFLSCFLRLLYTTIQYLGIYVLDPDWLDVVTHLSTF